MSTFATLKHEREPDVSPPIPTRRTREKEPPGEGNSRIWLWSSIVALATALACAGWYGLSRFGEQDSALTRLSGWPAELGVARNRIGAIEQRLRALPREIELLRGQVAALNADVSQRLAAGLDQAHSSARELGSVLRKEMRETSAAQQIATEARFRRLEEQRQAEAARSALLEQRVAHLDRRLSAAAQDLNHVQNSAAAESHRLSEEIRRTDGRVTREIHYNQRPRDRFEASKGRSVEIAPGIMLHITRVDPRYRRFNGWLQLIDDGRILWLRDESMLRSIAFHSGKYALRHDLIVTGLNSYGVSGYLIYPPKGESQPAEMIPVAAAGN